MPTFRFHFDLGALGPIVPTALEEAIRRALPDSTVIRVGVYGRVDGVRDGRPIGVQAIDVGTTTLSGAEVSEAVAHGLAALGMPRPVGDPELR